MAENLQHKGTIISIEGRLINVHLDVEQACCSCKIKDVCAAGGSEDKIVTLFSDLAQYFSVGEEVMVSIGRLMGIRAVLYAYILPFMLILSTLLILLGLYFSETVAGLSALGVAAVYYLILSLFRSKLEKDIVFKISKI